ncbi:MAG: hypothetical protein Q8O25_13605 [Sulfurisoma sp.]|nr:hypothetical protein [Sulfurisoma sp.]
MAMTEEKMGRSEEQEHRFAVNLMQHLVVPTFVLDAACRVVIWNKACERLTGVPAAGFAASLAMGVASAMPGDSGDCESLIAAAAAAPYRALPRQAHRPQPLRPGDGTRLKQSASRGGLENPRLRPYY